MTDVLVRLTTASSGAAASGWVPADEVAAVGHLECRPYAPDADGARLHLEGPDRLRLPASMPPVRLVGGETLLHLAATGAGWCWQIIERTPRGKTRYVLVPDSVATLDYGDLVDVDPLTLAPAAEPEAAWWAAIELLSGATAAAPELIRDTMGTALVAGENITITPDDTNDTITIAATGGGGGGDTFGEGVVPIFETLVQAEAWEAANPGRVALTLEGTGATPVPDTTPPTAGALSVAMSDTSAVVTVTGASDDRGAVQYAFRRGSNAYSAWQASAEYTFTGLTASTSYSFQHKVKDAANNETEGVAFTAETTAAPAVAYEAKAMSFVPTVYHTGNTLMEKLGPVNVMERGGGTPNAGAALGGYPTSYQMAVGNENISFTTWETYGTEWSAAILLQIRCTVPADITGDVNVLKFFNTGYDLKITNYIPAVAGTGELKFGPTGGRVVTGIVANTVIDETLLLGWDTTATGTHLYINGVEIAQLNARTWPTGTRGFIYALPAAWTGGVVEWRGFMIDNAPIGASGHLQLAQAAGLA